MEEAQLCHCAAKQRIFASTFSINFRALCATLHKGGCKLNTPLRRFELSRRCCYWHYFIRIWLWCLLLRFGVRDVLVAVMHRFYFRNKQPANSINLVHLQPKDTCVASENEVLGYEYHLSLKWNLCRPIHRPAAAYVDMSTKARKQSFFGTCATMRWTHIVVLGLQT